MDELLSVANLHKTFRSAQGTVHAVEDVSFNVLPGETLALVGKSGCGKSTVAFSLLRLIEPDSGRIVFDGSELMDAKGERLRQLRREISIVFQNPYSSLNPKMKIWEAVAEPIRIMHRLPKARLREKATRCLQDVGLGAQHLDRYPHEFSGGQRQRIAIARALALEPQLLILDEPTAALDVSVQAQVLNLLKSLQQRRSFSFLFISHNLATVEFISDRVLVMYLGRIVESGPVSEVFNRPFHPYTRALLDSVPSVDPEQRMNLKPPQGDIPSPMNRPAGCAFSTRCSHVMPKCEERVPGLESTTPQRAVACFRPLDQENAA